MNKILISIIVVVIIALGGVFYFFKGTINTEKNKTPNSSLVPVTVQKGNNNTLLQSEAKEFTQTATIESQSYFFKPDFIRVKVNEKATFTVNAYGNHTFTIDQFKVNVKTADGKKTQFSFTPNKKGAFHFYSSVPGDREAGMQGMLVVE